MKETLTSQKSAVSQESRVACARAEGDVSQRLEYWQAGLAGVSPSLDLPTDRPRPPVQRFQPGKIARAMPSQLWDAISRLGCEAQVDAYEVLLAAFQVLLFRYSGQEDLVVGCRLSEGNAGETIDHDRAACVPLRSNLGGNPTFQTLLRRVSQDLQGARENFVSLDHLIAALAYERDDSRNDIFQVLFSCASSRQGSARDCHTDLPVDLYLHIESTADGMSTEFTFDSQLFDPATISRTAEHFEILLNGIAANPNESIARLPLLSEAERNQVLLDWNQTHFDYPRHQCVHHLFEEQARRTPQAVAVVFEGRELIYAELDRRSNQLANYLLKFGIGPDALVALCVERGFDMVVGLLGILKAGAAYVPLDPAFPAERLTFMLEDSEAPVLLTQRHLVETLPANRSKMVCLDSEWEQIERETVQNPRVGVTPENLAYTIYTSGSTGKPKGVQVLHRGVVNFLASMAREPGMSSTDRVLSVTTLSFDIAGLEIYLPLSAGASVEIVSREVAADGTELLHQLNKSHATVMQATPATWRMLIEAGWEGTPGLKILCGGEALSQKLAEQLVERCASLWNMYGPTETTIWSTLSQVKPGHNAVLIGHPISNTQIYILDRLLQPTPIGVAGELHIGGDGVARGYFKRPDLTQSKFIPDPFSRDPGARLYKTGDLARYLRSGEVEFLGRIDHQVKIRGFRIELGEIETALRQHPDISEVVVIDREDTPGDKRLVAYLVPEQDAQPGIGELRAFLKERLPEYMVPSMFVPLKSMPLTPNGKVNRRALPAPDKSELATKSQRVPPRDETEAGLAEIWEQVLGVKPIGVRDNFFELGGHSLLAVRMTQRAGQRFGKKFPVATLLQAPTIELLAAIYREKDWTPHWTSLVPIQPGDSRPPFFCVHGAGGVIIRFRDLARHLGAEQPVYGFQAQGLDESLPCHNRVEDMAAHYIDEMRSIQPRGPYFVGGYSFGGMIALEMAHQLHQLGEETPLVVLFDTFCTPPPTNDQGAGAGDSSIVETLIWSAKKQAAALLSAKLVVKGILRRWEHMTVPRRLKMVRKSCEEAGHKYVPKNHAGKVILYRSSRPPVMQHDPYAGWTRYIGDGLEVQEIASDHDSIMLEPQVQLVAQHLKTRLTELHGRLTAEVIRS